MKHAYPEARQGRPEESRCNSTTKHGPRSGHRCGNVAILWPVGGNTCWKHGGDGDAYFEKFWAEYARLHRTPDVYIPTSVRRHLERICLGHYDSWQKRAERRWRKRQNQTESVEPALTSRRHAVREDLLKRFPYLAADVRALELYVDQRIDADRGRRT